MANIFICYRREDSGPAAGRIYDRLEHHFTRGQVFMDVDDIPFGVDYRDWLDRQIRQCDLVLVVMGRNWLSTTDPAGTRRLDAPRDFVRTEIEIALKRQIPLIPVLLEGAEMPLEDQLPVSIAPLAYRQAASVDAAGGHFRGHMEQLIRGIEWLLQHAGQGLPKPSPVDTNQRNPGPPRPTHPDPPPAPEIQSLLDEIDDPETPPPRRLEIGDALAKLGDPRPGVGLRTDGLPDIEWVEIHSGPFIYQKGERRELPTFWIGCYPVTNAQFQTFIDDGGYAQSRWWQDLVRPDPQEPRWPEPNRPRTDVDWYEAVAFSRWLAARLGLPAGSIRLPTELEWEKAARGDQGLIYPWGNEYRSGFANVDETFGERKGPWYLKQTTAVGLYPHGHSPDGVADLAGMVWEWCLNKPDHLEATAPDTSGALRALRGGSWFIRPDNARADFRYRNPPDNRYDFMGFRLLSSVPIEPVC